MTGKHKRRRHRLAALGVALAVTLGGLLSPMPLPSMATSVSDLQEQMEALEEEEQRLRSQLANYKNDMAKQQEYADSLQAKIENSEEQIELLRRQIELLNGEMGDKSAAIAEKERQIADKQQAIDDQFALFSERLRVISQSGNLTALQMIFNTEDYLEYLLKSNVISRIAENDQQMMDNLEAEMEALDAQRQQLESDRASLEEQRKQVESLKAEADDKKSELDTLYAECNAVLKKLQSSVDSTNAALSEKQKEEEALDAQIRQMLAAAAASSSPASSGHYTDGTMHWPVPAVHNISSGFGYRWGVLHRGIDIANGSVPIYGQNVVAAADGTVIYANTGGWGGGYGLYLMIDHGYDSSGRQIVTLYAHCSAILVGVGDKVTGGQTVVARAGSSGNVTGPHLHFEVRVNGTAVDPLANGYLQA